MNFNPEYSTLYIVISFLIALSLSYLYYRRTNVTIRSKVILISLRTFVISLFLILLLISYITFVKKITEKPVNIFLFDVSESMTLENRKEELIKSFDIINSIRNNKSENKYFLFSGDIIKEIELNEIRNLNTEDFKNEYTNLSKSLNSVSKTLGGRKISSMNIISDGIINEGGNPVYAFQQTQTIFNYILIGDSIQKNDLSLKNILFNPTAYIESNTQIQVELNSYNYSKDIKVKLFEEGNLSQEKKVYVNSKNTVYNCSFFVKSNIEGIKKYKIEIESEQDEITDKNNSEDFFIEFIDNKFKLLVLSGNPSPDFSYLTESIKRIINFNTKFFTLKSPATFYEGPLLSLNEFDLLILINFPNTTTDLNLVNNLSEDLKNLRLPVFFISGSNTDYEKLKLLKNYIPFSIINKSGNDEKSAVKYIDDLQIDKNNLFGLKKTTDNLPEINIPGINFSFIPDTRTILYSNKLSKPVLVISKNNERNSAALIAYNFYKWRLNNLGNENRNVLSDILTGISLSITDKEKSKKIYINLEKQVYSPYEYIKVNGFLNSVESIENSYVKLQVFNNSFSKEINISKTSSNSFSGEIIDLPVGEYFINCSLIQNGTELSKDIKKILIQELNIEYKHTKADKSILNDLSSNTRGKGIFRQNIDEINKKIELQNEEDLYFQKRIDKVFLNSSLIIMSFLILLFSIEWFLRKRLNLP